MTKIAQKILPKARVLHSRDGDASAKTRPPDLGLADPRKFLAGLLPPTPGEKVDLERGVVSLISQRGRTPAPRASRVEAVVDAAPVPDRDTTYRRAAALTAHQAESADEIAAARQLIQRRYAWRGYDVPVLAAPDATAQPEASAEITFVATDEVDTVGTITLGFDGSDGLLAERTHADAVAQRRAAGACVCELTRLAVAESADSRSVLAALFNVAYVAGSKRGVTDVFIEVNPRHVAFYTRVLGFAVAAAEKFCERVHAPSVLLSLAIEELERRLLELDLTLSSLSLSARAA